MSRSRRMLESARRVYGEVVRGRSRIRVVTETTTTAGTTPRFLLSPYRSGTTLMRYCLDSHPDLAVPPETDFLVPLLSVLRDEASMTGLAGVGYARADAVAKLASFARTFHDSYAAGWEATEGWLDKSPRYATEPHLLAEAFPDARFLVLHRHPLDQIHSFTRGGTFAHPALEVASGQQKETILAAARYWDDVTTGLRSFASESADTTATVTYEALCESPRETLAIVLDHLRLPWSDNVVNYHQFDHDLGREGGRVAGTVGFSASQGGWSRWLEGLADEVWGIVAETARPIGYKQP